MYHKIILFRNVTLLYVFPYYSTALWMILIQERKKSTNSSSSHHGVKQVHTFFAALINIIRGKIKQQFFVVVIWKATIFITHATWRKNIGTNQMMTKINESPLVRITQFFVCWCFQFEMGDKNKATGRSLNLIFYTYSVIY